MFWTPKIMSKFDISTVFVFGKNGMDDVYSIQESVHIYSYSWNNFEFGWFQQSSICVADSEIISTISTS